VRLPFPQREGGLKLPNDALKQIMSDADAKESTLKIGLWCRAETGSEEIFQI
jgi:hypothetical protein